MIQKIKNLGVNAAIMVAFIPTLAAGTLIPTLIGGTAGAWVQNGFKAFPVIDTVVRFKNTALETGTIVGALPAGIMGMSLTAAGFGLLAERLTAYQRSR